MCFLFSYLNPAHELRVKRDPRREHLADMPVSISYDVSAEVEGI